MIDHSHIYQHQGQQYQQLIDREDFQGNLLIALEQITDFTGKKVLDLGAGTGRLTAMLINQLHSMIASDISRHMLSVALQRLSPSVSDRWIPVVADHRYLPLGDDHFDILVSGWSFSYLKTWTDAYWQAEVDRGLREIDRVLIPDGVVIFIETLGTGMKSPKAPDELRDFYVYLEQLGFESTWLRTDYRFQSPKEAEELIQFFFGSAMLEFLSTDDFPILPECTGIWWR